MTKNLLTLILTFLFTDALAQYNQGARLKAMANASAAVNDVWSLNANPAGITGLKSSMVALNYARYLFGDELSEQSFAFVHPFGNNFAGLSINRYGISEFNEIKAGFCFAKKFGDDLAIGVKANIHQIKITNYGNATTFSVDAGVNYSLSKQIGLGVFVNNPSSQKYKATNVETYIPAAVHFGASYTPSNKVLLAINVSKDLERKFDVALGVDYKFYELLSLRGGLSAKPFKQYFGIGLNYQKWILDIAVESHPQIGYTPQIGLSYAL
ncbi:hypothetical protein [Pedobacter xixiisoli]|uniref:PorV/PorQ family protein n=1 Tax=Pedobacter xixiisoli TaxID=1476464 RepID=A0A285ZSU3_9SPHI|nr:hypothetical protein [Pedobacter xixiisoli]SOD12722.1 hypothetical protein SAMN06297358_0814 [Pedobacter xixiisoli]